MPPQLGAWILALMSASAGCADNTQIELGLIEMDGNAVLIQVPSSAKVGEIIVVKLSTYGVGGCTFFESTEINVIGDEAEITPYDRSKVSGSKCLASLEVFNHDALVTFETAGSNVIRINGRHTGHVGREKIDEVVQLSFPMMVAE